MKYKLSIRCEISQCDDSGYAYGSPGLKVEETVDLGVVNFLETAAILGRFHEVAEDIKAKQHQGDKPDTCECVCANCSGCTHLV